MLLPAATAVASMALDAVDVGLHHPGFFYVCASVHLCAVCLYPFLGLCECMWLYYVCASVHAQIRPCTVCRCVSVCLCMSVCYGASGHVSVWLCLSGCVFLAILTILSYLQPCCAWKQRFIIPVLCIQHHLTLLLHWSLARKVQAQNMLTEAQTGRCFLDSSTNG